MKSGASYFANPSHPGRKFCPETKHQTCWESVPLPAFFVLRDPNPNICCRTDVRQELRSPERVGKAFVKVPARNVPENAKVFKFFENAGAHNQPFIDDLDDVLAKPLSTSSQESSFSLSHFDLFAHGLTDICRRIYAALFLESQDGAGLSKRLFRSFRSDKRYC